MRLIIRRYSLLVSLRGWGGGGGFSAVGLRGTGCRTLLSMEEVSYWMGAVELGEGKEEESCAVCQSLSMGEIGFGAWKGSVRP